MNTLTSLAKAICNDGMVCDLVYAGLLAALVFSVPVIMFTSI